MGIIEYIERLYKKVHHESKNYRSDSSCLQTAKLAEDEGDEEEEEEESVDDEPVDDEPVVVD